MRPHKCNDLPCSQGPQTRNLVQPPGLRSKFLRDTGEPAGPRWSCPRAHSPSPSEPTQRLHGHGEPSPLAAQGDPLPPLTRTGAAHARPARSQGLPLGVTRRDGARPFPSPGQAAVDPRAPQTTRPRPPVRRGPASPKPPKFSAALSLTLRIAWSGALWSDAWPSWQLAPHPASALHGQSAPSRGPAHRTRSEDRTCPWSRPLTPAEPARPLRGPLSPQRARLQLPALSRRSTEHGARPACGLRGACSPPWASTGPVVSDPAGHKPGLPCGALWQEPLGRWLGGIPLCFSGRPEGHLPLPRGTLQ
ncbi:splicing factor 3B subunit 4-like [Suricata suricatta]|uniref:splicing factor 3B subunit 4-like n=1 Tax=Suricata suricatta TaxID=37032 RepID=UPI0011553A1A|nr:splicing factor 3B subunit 4-like [Suricata suricatta]